MTVFEAVITIERANTKDCCQLSEGVANNLRLRTTSFLG